jgi:hypothetical protein
VLSSLCVFFCSINPPTHISLCSLVVPQTAYILSSPWSAPFGANGFVMIRAWPLASLLDHMLPKMSLTVTTTASLRFV